ncbi:uncharacterized protein LOC119118436 isoform X1 [Syngnathus acus]|uniref:uncharacterized protein LOC119118436 isoform X1 n=1 Tax=Syngnathus acus TaxID=161584 RepID=UPI0018861268|nr:uncharacterized protein LOC119118436 isoform X1 [Syngnathus acus]
MAAPDLLDPKSATHNAKPRLSFSAQPAAPTCAEEDELAGGRATVMRWKTVSAIFFLVVLYLVIGATVFRALEQPFESSRKMAILADKLEFLALHGCVNSSELEDLVKVSPRRSRLFGFLLCASDCPSPASGFRRPSRCEPVGRLVQPEQPVGPQLRLLLCRDRHHHHRVRQHLSPHGRRTDILHHLRADGDPPLRLPVGRRGRPAGHHFWQGNRQSGEDDREVESQPDQDPRHLHLALHPVRLPHLCGAAGRHLQAHRGLERAGVHLLCGHHAHHHRIWRLCRRGKRRFRESGVPQVLQAGGVVLDPGGSGVLCRRAQHDQRLVPRHLQKNQGGGGRVPGPRRRVDGQRVGRVQGNPAAAERGHLRPVPARRLHQAQTVLGAGHQRLGRPGNDARQTDAVGQPGRGSRGLRQPDAGAGTRPGSPEQKRQPLPQRAQPGLCPAAGGGPGGKPQMRAAKRFTSWLGRVTDAFSPEFSATKGSVGSPVNARHKQTGRIKMHQRKNKTEEASCNHKERILMNKRKHW